MIKIGRQNKLKIIKEVQFGMYLDGGDFGEILLPKKYIPKDLKADNEIEVFVYFDSEDRIVATTEKPYAAIGEFAYLKTVSVTKIGAFLDWGLTKDLFVPFKEQRQKMIKGHSYIVYIYYDKKSDRIAGSSKLDKFFSKWPPEYEAGESVDLLIWNETELGFNAIVNNSHRGLLYKNELFQPLLTGQKIKGFVNKIREDGKIDLTLQKPGYDKVSGLAEKILEELKRHNGFIALTDKTSPEKIHTIFGVSKKTYKKAAGALYKKRLISIEKNGIRLKKKDIRKKK